MYHSFIPLTFYLTHSFSAQILSNMEMSLKGFPCNVDIGNMPLGLTSIGAMSRILLDSLSNHLVHNSSIPWNLAERFSFSQQIAHTDNIDRSSIFYCESQQ